ncbi:DEAD/DEAH box helicase [Iodidimonas sp. SYSU 1G8]|uniref:DEAD/DEAH box helicase n=1 Tax=Iodidimonas sp. SYSU 1G8 TaxID=3133967 RepID=UPI0031FF01AC
MTTTFNDLGLIEPLLRALTTENYTIPTPIQAQAIPLLLQGKDLLGIAQTGTGKTAAFTLPMLQRLAAEKIQAAPKTARALILAPTRELAVQIADSIRNYGRNLGLRQAVILGGVGQNPQIKAMSRGVDVLVATPGRLLDLVNQKHVNLSGTGILVLDEADRMLDMGFIRDVRKIVSVMPRKRQSLLFSATMPTDVAKLASDMLIDPVRVEVTPAATTVERIDQSVYFIDAGGKQALLTRLLQDKAMSKVIVFTRTKHRANRVAEQLSKSGLPADAIHGNKSQSARQNALDRFKTGAARVLVATDIAARGIDVDGITHVINFELPNEPESYVHRIGRTARAGAEGIAIAFCDPTERAYLRGIEKLTRVTLSVVGETPRDTGESPPENGRNRPRTQAPRGRGGRPQESRHGEGRPAEGQQADGRTGDAKSGAARRRRRPRRSPMQQAA